eukprot:5201359-Amphidinium_carterae.1
METMRQPTVPLIKSTEFPTVEACFRVKPLLAPSVFFHWPCSRGVGSAERNKSTSSSWMLTKKSTIPTFRPRFRLTYVAPRCARLSTCHCGPLSAVVVDQDNHQLAPWFVLSRCRYG